jgi:hypothetical protein
VPVGEKADRPVTAVDPLKYQKQTPRPNGSDELMTVKLRYKQPNESRSQLIVTPVKSVPVRFGQASQDFQFASAVAAFGMLLRDSESRGNATYASILEIANATLGKDQHGYRREFVQMVAAAGRLAGEQVPAVSYVPPLYDQPSQSPPAVVHYTPAAVRPQTGMAFHSDLLLWAVVIASAIVTICAVTMAIWLGSRFLILPTAAGEEQHAWPCTQKQRGCTTHKPPVRKAQGAWK